ncbi:alpha/beta fold hydrolase [Caulobacter sp. NIBR2454]|uniref:alpha/beta fold hydrolase n=1 Tax=Caulobacter sp. NIBR2454 TaxID=3015996 RepID=UPI0022B716A9|nr:alpha/beta hydrolase [Caulobacter sp. NIBR2454]
MRLISAALLSTFALSAHAQTAPAADPYAQGKAIVADIQKIVTPNGVSESGPMTLGGASQWVSIRGADRANPIIIFIHGGPAAPELPLAWTFQRPWEDFFTVVQWDQRGAGKSYALNDPKAIAATMTVDQYRDDTIDLIEQVTKKLGKRRVILVGHSWGSIVGLSVAAKRPDLLHAYVGAGQVIDFRENERVGFNAVLAAARKAGNAEAVAELEALQPYPGPGDFDTKKIETQRKWSIHYGFLSAGRDNARHYFLSSRLSPDYGPDDLKGWSKGSDMAVETLLPKLADVSFNHVRKLDTPTFMFLGRQDYTTPGSITEDWMKGLRAPKKDVVWFEHSAHLMMVEEPGRFLYALLDKVRPIAERAEPEAPKRD